MYKIFVNCNRLAIKLDIITMHKHFLLLLLISFYSCEKNESNDILPHVSVSVTIDLNLPQYLDLQTPSGWVYTNGGLKGILIQNTGVGSPP
jgi:hypothetical protein